MSKRVVSFLVCLVMIMGISLSTVYSEPIGDMLFSAIYVGYKDSSQNELIIEGYFYNVGNTIATGVNDLMFVVHDRNGNFVTYTVFVDDVDLFNIKLNPGECEYWGFTITGPNKGMDLSKWIVDTNFMYDSGEEVQLEKGVKVYYKGKKVDFSQTKPKIENGRTLVPIREITEAMGATVEWDEKAKAAIITRDDIFIVLHIGDKDAFINEDKVTLDVPARIENGRTLVPLRFIGKAFGANILWGPDTETIIMSE